MRESMRAYHRAVAEVYEAILADEGNVAAFGVAGKRIADRLAQDKLVYLVGPGGHSNMTTEECLCRAGMPVQLSPMIDATNLLHGTTKTRYLQRAGGYAKGLLEEYGLEAGDVLILINAYGVNYLSIDMGIQARKLGVYVIGISSPEFGRALPKDHPARHPEGLNLEDVCDVLIDCKMPYGDAVIDAAGADQKLGPTSSLCNIFTINLLLLEAVGELIERGVTPQIWRSINLPGGDAYNSAYFRDYGQRIRYLL